MTALVIENEDVIRLLKVLSEREGKSESEVIRELAQARLDTQSFSKARERRPGERASRLLEIGRSTAPLWQERHLSIQHGDILYDENGLPT